MTTPTLTQPTCPDWCDGRCATCCDAPACHLRHTQKAVFVDGTNLLLDGPDAGTPNFAQLGLERQDTADRPGATYVDLDLQEVPLRLTPTQARELAAALNLLADQGEKR